MFLSFFCFKVMTSRWWLYQMHPQCCFAVPTTVHIFLPSIREFHGVHFQRPSHSPKLQSDYYILKDGWVTYIGTFDMRRVNNMARRKCMENLVVIGWPVVQVCTKISGINKKKQGILEGIGEFKWNIWLNIWGN